MAISLNDHENRIKSFEGKLPDIESRLDNISANMKDVFVYKFKNRIPNASIWQSETLTDIPSKYIMCRMDLYVTGPTYARLNTSHYNGSMYSNVYMSLNKDQTLGTTWVMFGNLGSNYSGTTLHGIARDSSGFKLVKGDDDSNGLSGILVFYND